MSEIKEIIGRLKCLYHYRILSKWDNIYLTDNEWDRHIDEFSKRHKLGDRSILLSRIYFNGISKIKEIEILE